MGDFATLGRMGKSIVIRFIGIEFVVSAVSLVSVLPFVSLNFSSGGQEQTSFFEQISQMFFDIIPTNIVDPFKTGNTFHIIVIAMLIGSALLAIGERGSRLRGLIEEGALLFQQIVSSICGLIPLFVFSMLLQLIWSGQARTLITVIKPIILIAALVMILVAVLLIIASLLLEYPPMPLVKKVMPASVIYFTVLVCTFAESYQIAVNIPWLILAVVISTLITIAMPPVPGADILCYTILFSNLNIPAEAIVLATAIGIVFDYIVTGANVLLLIIQIACDAKRLGKLDQKILRDK